MPNIELRHSPKRKTALFRAAIILTLAAALLSCSGRQSPHVIVRVSDPSISRLPYVIAMDQGLYAKNGVDVELWIPSPGSDTLEVHASLFYRALRAFGITPREPDIETNGGSPMMVNAIEKGEARHRIAIASTDCVTRAHIIGRKGIATLADLKGRRIGVATRESTSGFHALLLARRMGWDPGRDIILVEHAEDIAHLLDNSVDAIVGYERDYATATRDGLPILADTQEWDDAVAGNSTLVDPDWLRDPTHRDAARRFLRATIEGIALMKRDPNLTRRIMRTWYGIADPQIAALVYARGAWVPKKPYPCSAGFARTFDLYDSIANRAPTATEFYDDSLVRELDASGYIDSLYKEEPKGPAPSEPERTGSTH